MKTTLRNDSAPPVLEHREAAKQNDTPNNSRIRATVKRLIVALAVREILPANAATWLINVLGLRGA